MRLLSIKTSGYRNLTGEELQLSEGINLLYGSNAAGKTNTLECAYIFASGKSFRARHESELIKKGENTARADISLLSKNIKQDMSVIWYNSKEKGFVKRLVCGGYEVPKTSEFLGIFRAVLFTPDHLSLIKGSPEERRKFMDIALSQMQPRYVYYMNSYLKVLSQKNAYLKSVMLSGRADNDYLEILNGQLAKTASVLIKQRNGFAERLKEYSSDFYGKLTDSKEKLDVKYISPLKKTFSDTEEAEARLMEIYASDRESEIRQGKTLHGPHRDDLMVYISNAAGIEPENDGTEMQISELAARTFGSQGQQRSAVLAIKLAEGEICKSVTGEYPVFLLDDLLGELDLERRSRLARLIRDKQAVITCCDRESVPKIDGINAVRVADGRYYRD